MFETSALTPRRLAVALAAAGFLFAAPASAQTQLPPPAYGQADQRQDRIEELESQLRASEAEKEDLQRQLIEANREITRLRGLVGELAGVNQSLATTPPAGAASPPASTPAPQPERRSEVAPTQPTLSQQGSLGTLPASALPGDAGQAYGQARELLVNGRYAEAELAFSQFLQSFPDAATAADARFWYGFTLYARSNYEGSRDAFVEYLRAAPNGPRAPEAQARLGMAFAQLGQTRQACTAFTNLPRRYPNAPRNVRDLAAREATALRCAA
jgi:tol-pal system protein YbgF